MMAAMSGASMGGLICLSLGCMYVHFKFIRGTVGLKYGCHMLLILTCTGVLTGAVVGAVSTFLSQV